MLERIGSNLEHYLDLLTARQKLVASNIANVDTPGYRAKDIDFATQFRGAVTGDPQVSEVEGLTTRTDGNNVSLDREMRLLAENGLHFQIASALLRTELQNVRLAIQDGKSS